MEDKNQRIKETETTILKYKNDYKKRKKLLDMKILSEVNKLEADYKITKDARLSNLDKRHSIVMSRDDIYQEADALDTLELDIQIGEIHLRYLNRDYEWRVAFQITEL